MSQEKNEKQNQNQSRAQGGQRRDQNKRPRRNQNHGRQANRNRPPPRRTGPPPGQKRDRSWDSRQRNWNEGDHRRLGAESEWDDPWADEQERLMFHDFREDRRISEYVPRERSPFSYFDADRSLLDFDDNCDGLRHPMRPDWIDERMQFQQQFERDRNLPIHSRKEHERAVDSGRQENLERDHHLLSTFRAEDQNLLLAEQEKLRLLEENLASREELERQLHQRHVSEQNEASHLSRQRFDREHQQDRLSDHLSRHDLERELHLLRTRPETGQGRVQDGLSPDLNRERHLRQMAVQSGILDTVPRGDFHREPLFREDHTSGVGLDREPRLKGRSQLSTDIKQEHQPRLLTEQGGILNQISRDDLARKWQLKLMAEQDEVAHHSKEDLERDLYMRFMAAQSEVSEQLSRQVLERKFGLRLLAEEGGTSKGLADLDLQQRLLAGQNLAPDLVHKEVQLRDYDSLKTAISSTEGLVSVGQNVDPASLEVPSSSSQTSYPRIEQMSQEQVSLAILNALGTCNNQSISNTDQKSTHTSTSQTKSDAASALSVCPLITCRTAVLQLRQHILVSHLPVCFSNLSDLSNSTMRQRSIVLHAFAREFTEEIGLPSLLEMVESSGLMHGAPEVENDSVPALCAFSQFLGEDVPKKYTLNPPNACAVLTHWHVLLQLLCAGGKKLQERFSSQSQAQKKGQTLQASVQSAQPTSQVVSEQSSVSNAVAIGVHATSLSGTLTPSIPQGLTHGACPVPQISTTGSVAQTSDSFEGTGSVDLSVPSLSRGNAEHEWSGPEFSEGRTGVHVDYSHQSIMSGPELSKSHKQQRDMHVSSASYPKQFHPHGQSGNPDSSTGDLPSVNLAAEKSQSSGSISVKNQPGNLLQSARSNTEKRKRQKKDRKKVSQEEKWCTETKRQKAGFANASLLVDSGQAEVIQSELPALGLSGEKLHIPTSLEPGLPKAFDCHFYLDIMAIIGYGKTTLGRGGVTFSDVLSICTVPKTNHIDLAGAVASFSNPDNYDLLSNRKAFGSGQSYVRTELTSDPRLGLSVGLNPKFIARLCDSFMSHIGHLSKLPGMVAFGDVGLSYCTGSEKDWKEQRLSLRQLLRLASPGKPVKLSCRKAQQVQGGARPDAYKDLLTIASEELPSSQPIYLVSFSGSVTTAKLWMSQFPRCYFGVSPKCINSGHDIKTTLQFVPANRLLLESSAPAFMIPGYNKNSPLFLGMLAMYVAKIRGLQDAREILAITTENARHFFQL